MLSANQLGKQCAAAADDDDCATHATTQESRWRAGVNRQAQQSAQLHQVAASQAAAAKLTSTAMPPEERKAKRAAHAAEVRAKEAAKRAAAAEVARAEAAAARVPTRRQLNMWLKEEGDEVSCDRDEWDAFEDYTMNALGVSGFDDLEDEDLEQEVFMVLFFDWRSSDECKRYEIENEVNQVDYDDCEPALPMAPAEVRQQFGPRQPSPPPPDDGDDPWGGGSADMYYDGPGNEAAPRELDELPPGMSIDDWWDKVANLEYVRAERRAEFENRKFAKEPHEQRRQRELAAGPPPRREQEKYGPRGDAAGDHILIVRCGMSASQVARSLMLLCRSRMTCVMPSRGGSASTAMVGPVARVSDV